MDLTSGKFYNYFSLILQKTAAKRPTHGTTPAAFTVWRRKSTGLFFCNLSALWCRHCVMRLELSILYLLVGWWTVVFYVFADVVEAFHWRNLVRTPAGGAVVRVCTFGYIRKDERCAVITNDLVLALSDVFSLPQRFELDCSCHYYPGCLTIRRLFWLIKFLLHQCWLI